MKLLRLAAWAIAIAGVVDPAIALSGASRARLAIVVTQPSSPAAEAARDRLTLDLSASYDIVPQVVSDAAAAIVIGERFPDESVPDAMLVSTVSAPDAVARGVRIVTVRAPSVVPAATLIHLDVDLEASLVAGHTSDVTASIAGLETGRVSHRWTANQERWHASIDAVPVGDPPYLVQVGLQSDTASMASPIAADVAVDVRRTPLRVEFYDPRPSWATTFLRRALEADARFQVSTLSFPSRGVSAQTGGAVPPSDPRLDAFDVVILGGLDRLSAAEGGGLDRYMRVRGGTLVVVPDQRLDAGPALELVPGGLLTERLLEQPATLTVTPPAGSLLASELLVMRTVPPGVDVIARVPDADPAKALPVIVAAPRGRGRVLLSGAMDAWRFRAAERAAFDRFWQSAIAGLALAVVPPVAIGVDPPLIRPGEPGTVTVRLRPGDVTAVSAMIDGDQPVRLLPDPEAGLFRGRFVAKQTPGLSAIEVHVSAAQPLSASHRFVVSARAHRLAANAAPLALLASSHRGIDVSPDRIPELERFVRRAVVGPRARQIRHPMRSAWWMLPFALGLSAEWWLRRRRGLR